MRAVTCTDTVLEVADLPAPVPERGQLLLRVLRCGICGSDLHARRHADQLQEVTALVGYDGIFRSSDSVVLGHEICGEVVDSGPRTRTSLRPGTRVVTFPLVRRGRDVHAVGLSTSAPGGYAEQLVAQAAMTLAVPNGLDTDVAALTEPMAVGLHAVRRGEVGKDQVAIVIGCGPVGLAVIGMLKATGVRTVVAADLSPGRRALATTLGADVVVDPMVESAYDAANRQPRGRAHLLGADDIFQLAVGSMEKLRRLPLVPWDGVYRVAERLGAATPKHPVVFECVGVPGMLDQVIASAPLASRVVVVGVCMAPDTIRPALAINKEVDLRFVLGYTPLEFRDALHLLADGKVDAAPIVTGVVGLDGVAGAFDALADPESHAKILIDPSSDATL